MLDDSRVGFAASILLLTVGVILRFQLDVPYFVDYRLVGEVFLVLGALGFALSFLLRRRWPGSAFAPGDATEPS